MAEIRYVAKLRSLELDQVRASGLGTVYRILAIESTGYCICRKLNLGKPKETHRIWCDNLESWRIMGRGGK